MSNLLQYKLYKIQNIKTSSVYGGKQEEEQTWFDLFNGTFTF